MKNLILISAHMEQFGNTFTRFLDGHPNLFVTPFESQIGTPYSHNLFSSEVHFRYHYPEFKIGITPQEAYDSMYDEELKTFLKTPQRSKFKNCGMKMSEKDRKDFFLIILNNKLGDGPLKRSDYVQAYFDSTFLSWKNYHNKINVNFWVGYNPQMIMDTDKVFQDFPEAHVIHIIRSPFAAYADHLTRPFPTSIETYCKLWNTTQLYALNYSGKYTNFNIIRIEDFFQDKKRIMKSLCEGIGIKYDPILLYPSFNAKKLTSLPPWGAVKEPTLKYNKEAAARLTKDQIKKISIECAFMLNRLDYKTP